VLTARLLADFSDSLKPHLRRHTKITVAKRGIQSLQLSLCCDHVFRDLLQQLYQLDGCTRMQALRKVVLPVAVPGVISIALFAFLMSWNEFVLASVLTNTDSSKTLPIGLSEFATMFSVDWGSTMAAAFLMTVPVVAVFLAFQKQFVRGLSAGAVKG